MYFVFEITCCLAWAHIQIVFNCTYIIFDLRSAIQAANWNLSSYELCDSIETTIPAINNKQRHLQVIGIRQEFAVYNGPYHNTKHRVYHLYIQITVRSCVCMCKKT